jgi:hypothetical protein
MVGEVVNVLVIGLATFAGMMIYWRLARTELAHGPALPSAIAGGIAAVLTLIVGWLW